MIEKPKEYLEVLLAQVTVGVLIPLLILGLLVILSWVVLARANKDPKFKIAEVFLDENGKVSNERVTNMGTWVASTYMMVVILFAQPQYIEMGFYTYMGAWAISGAWKYTAKAKYEAAQVKPDPAGQPPQGG